METMTSDYVRKKRRLKRQWSYIAAALKLVQLNEQAEKKRLLLDAITKSDSVIFDQLLEEDIALLDGPIPTGYNYSNLYQIILERSTDTFIDRCFTKYFDRFAQSTDGGKSLVPVACERGDGTILKLILKHFPRAPLTGISHASPIHHSYDPLTKREFEAYLNEIPLACVIRNDRSDLLSILLQFQSFTFDVFTPTEKEQCFYLCLLAEHRHVTVDKFNMKWWKNQCLSPCGSIDCLRLLIESVRFNPLKFLLDEQCSHLSPFTVILEPIYLNLLEFHSRFITDRSLSISIRLIRAFVDLIRKQFSIFTYLITHCLLEPNESDLIRVNECFHYIEEVFHQHKEFFSSVRPLMMNLLQIIDDPTYRRCVSLKNLCRSKIRNHLRHRRSPLVHVENTFVNLSPTHRNFLK